MGKTIVVISALMACLASVAAETDAAKATATAQSATTATAAAQTKGTMSLADARSQIDKVIESPKKMTEIMKSLSAADQKQFVADVNKAIGELPGSVEEKTAKYLNVNEAALRGAAPGNLGTLVAEVFATVPPESLTVLNERFAIDLFSRSADPSTTYTDAQFEAIAKEVIEKVNERCEETDNGSPRVAFAILMFVRASEGTPENLADTLIDTMKHEDARELARTEWIPSALGQNDRQQSYESILASADAGRRPDLDFTLVIAGPQFHDSVLQDLMGKNNDPMAFMNTRTPVLDAVENPLVRQIPVLGGNVGGDVGEASKEHKEEGDIKPPERPEPSPYNGQVIY